MIIKNVRDLQKSNIHRIQKKMKRLKSRSVSCGIHKKDNIPYPEAPDVTLAQVGVWNEFGTYNIPPTMILRYLAYVKSENTRFKKVIYDNLKEQTEEKALRNIGKYMQYRTKYRIINRKLPPNAPFTVVGGWMKNKKSGKVFYAEGKGHDIRMLRSGLFVNHIKYEVH